MSSTTYDHFANPGKLYATSKHFGNVNKMVRRNAGQLPQPFWLAHGCGAGSAATGSARI